ncbi:hypothetical protein K1T71_015319 [Dendrolimus kikuchii]|nr:hypothetical protein K1T71_015319 [Dendrolimus kikuchii]
MHTYSIILLNFVARARLPFRLGSPILMLITLSGWVPRELICQGLLPTNLLSPMDSLSESLNGGDKTLSISTPRRHRSTYSLPKKLHSSNRFSSKELPLPPPRVLGSSVLTSRTMFRGHLEGKAKLASKKLGMLNRSKQYFTPRQRFVLCKTQVSPHMDLHSPGNESSTPRSFGDGPSPRLPRRIRSGPGLSPNQIRWITRMATQDPADPPRQVSVLRVCVRVLAAVYVRVLAGVYYELSKKAKAVADVDYPAYGVTGPTIDISGDRKLAQSAHIYQHQKQQIIAMERNGLEHRNGPVFDPESEEENKEGDYTVYECPGFATTGDMEVKNPLFSEDPTPATPGKFEVVKPQPKD